MTLVDIVGSGHMARGLATRLLQGRTDVRITGRNQDQVAELVESLGAGASAAPGGGPFTGEVVILAVPYGSVAGIIREHGDALAGKVVVDISNPVDFATMDRLTTPEGTSAAEETAALLEGRADVVKAFNTTFAKTLIQGTVADLPLDVFVAGDSESAKLQVTEIIARSGMRPVDTGPLRWSRQLESFMLLVMALQVNPEHERFDWDTALKILP
ncbi:NAD(P)-binding domain-containing protein [Arthrobacter gandavensis]|uniref:NADPH-dependent F420 reductase n=1 Tax=Arthrobacter gandavensis TaxID=169960 RepID=UPI00188E7D38|nr:NAD(P)-binding domain-containing protein [Arthrobacter gandavensis]MBF4992580.1 NAD(P)-binding domain-containing protein [Arthrobacter gandavensis]